MNTFSPRQKLISNDVNTNFQNLASGEDMHYNAGWSTYNVGWYSVGSSTDPSLGNGTLHGRYIRMGRLVIVRIFWKAGSTTSYGSSVWEFSLPPLLPKSIDDYDDTASIGYNCGVCYVEDLATTAYFGSIDMMPAYSRVRVLIHRADSTYSVENWVLQATPFTFATGDFISCLFSYETEVSIT